MSKHRSPVPSGKLQTTPEANMEKFMQFLFAPARIAAMLAALFLQLLPARAYNADDTAAVALGGPITIGGMLKGSPVWDSYRRRFISEAGRIVDTGNGGFSHSEGQGYGLLLAVAAADRQTFDQILTWTTLHLDTRNDNLAAWRWTDSSRRSQDKHNASDGDLLIAWALAEAADLWSDQGYLSAAQAITHDIVGKAVKATRNFGPVLMPAAEGFGARERPDGPVVNLSYWVYPAFYRLAQIEPEFDWNALMQSGLDLLGAAHFGSSDLPPDWLSLATKAVAPAQGFEVRYGYDALRIPLYLFWADAVTPERMLPFEAAWPTGAAIVDRSGTATALAEPGYQAVAALLRCGARGAKYPQSFYRFAENQNYYPATLHLLSLMAATMHPGACLDPRAISEIVSPDWKPQTGALTRLTSENVVMAAPAPVASAAARPSPRKARPVAKENGDMLEDADLFSYLRIAAGVLTVLAGLYYLLSRQGEPRAEDQADAGSGGWQPAPGQYDVVPRTLPKNPFSGLANGAVLADELEVAAAASVRLSRTVGLIYFQLPTLAAFESQYGAAAAETLMDTLAQDFRRAVRATDNVAILSRSEILVAVCLLASRKDLETVASRLTAAARRRELIEEGAPSLPVGLAIYPLDGYSGAELIESAKRHHRELLPRQEEPPQEAPRAAAQQAEATSHTRVRKRSRRRPARKSQAPQPAA